jgi:hypothetical protein
MIPFITQIPAACQTQSAEIGKISIPPGAFPDFSHNLRLTLKPFRERDILLLAPIAMQGYNIIRKRLRESKDSHYALADLPS